VLCRCLTVLIAAAAFGAPAIVRADSSEAPPAPTRSEVSDRDGGEDEAERPFRLVTGLRVEQWIAPAPDHLRFNVRFSLPEASIGEHMSVAAFAWERLDVAEGKSQDSENGTVYQMLGTRYRRETENYGYFIGAHILTWSGRARPVTPWLGLRLGPVDGPSISADARLLGLGPQGGEQQSPLDDTDIGLAIHGPRLGPCQIGLRGRARDVRHPDRHQREQMLSLGVGFGMGKKRLFVGLGIQHQVRRATAAAEEPGSMMTTARMTEPAEPAGPARLNSTAVMLHLDAETPLPRSLLPD
jgi:hypothetical protein